LRIMLVSSGKKKIFLVFLEARSLR